MADDQEHAGEGRGPSSAPALPRSLLHELQTAPVAKPAIKVITDEEATPSSEGEVVTVRKNKDTAAIDRLPRDVSKDTVPLAADDLSSVSIGDLASAHEEATTETDALDDDATDDAIDDIERREGDELLEAEDASRGSRNPVQSPKRKRGLLSRWLHSSAARWLTFLVILAAAGVVGSVSTSRYWVLNKIGVRASLTLNTVDVGTQLPLENVTIRADGQQAITDGHGVATLHHLHLGPTDVQISRVAFASQTHHVIVGWGGNPLGSFTLQATGVRYQIKAVDYFSGAVITGVRAQADDGSEAPAANDGLITLTLDTNGSDAGSTTLSAVGYQPATVTLKPHTVNTVSLTPSDPDIFVAKDGGMYNVDATDADGSNRRTILSGTGHETATTTALAVSPDNTAAALVSVRAAPSSGTSPQSITLITTATGAATTIDQASTIKLLGWSGSTLVYETLATATGSPNAARIKIVSYNYATSTRLQLASADDFNAVTVVGNVLYYAVSSSDPSATAQCFSVRFDGSARQTILSQEAIGFHRSSYATLMLQTSAGWFAYDLQAGGAAPAAASPTDENLNFSLSPDGKHAVSIVHKNGVPSLQVYTVADGTTATFALPVSASYPLHWLNNQTAVVRGGAASAPVDYGVGIAGGTAKKIVSVVNIPGFSL